MTEIAVVIPCYDLGAFLEEALDSVLGQSRPAAEIVVVDDGSTDPATRQVLATVQEPRTRVVRTANRGAGAARNHGIRLTSAPYIVTLDADDMLAPDYLEATAQRLDTEPRLGFVSTAYQAFGDASFVWTPPACNLVTALTQGAAHVASMFRRPLWEAVGGFDETLRTAEDLEFWISAMERGFEGEVLDRPLLRCRVRTDSKHHRNVAQGGYLAAMRAILQKHRRTVERLGPQLLLAKEAFLLAQRAHQRHLETSTAAFLMSETSQAPGALYEGYHDIADCDTISGWAWDRNQPDRPVNVDIYDGDVPFATLTANVFREDLRDAGKGDGRHGFYCPVPFWLKDGQPHCIRVKIAGTEVELATTGKVINCELPLLSEIRRARTSVQSSPRDVGARFPARPLAIFTPYVGGLSETFIRRHLDRLLPDRTVVITNTLGGPYGGHWGVECPTLVLDGPPSASADLAREAEAFLRRHDVQVILGEYLNESLPWLPLARELKLRFFAHAHGYDVSRLLRDPDWRARYQEYALADGIITMSHHSRSRLVDAGLAMATIHVIPYGVDIPDQRVARHDGGAVRCVAVGRMVAKKAPILTLDAFRRAAAIVPELQLDYVGGGELLPAARQFVHAFGLDRHVTLHGPQPPEAVQRLLGEADVFLQHSVTDPETGDEEGLPVAVLEAMAHGLPVLSTRHAGIPEAVEDGTTGYLVAEGDSPGMADRLVGLATDPALRHRLGEAGWRRAKANFSWEQSRAALLTVLSLRETSGV